MRRVSTKFFILFAIFCMLLIVYSASAKDDSATAKKLVTQTAKAGGHNHPDYYTGKHGFMNEEAAGTLEKDLYLMSWLVLDPPLKLGAGGGIASQNKDLLKEYFGVSEIDACKNVRSYPYAGMKSIKPNSDKEDMYFTPINFMDLVDAKQGALFASGNQFDWVEWGGQGVNQAHEYLFCLAKWNKAGEINIKVGSDDPETTWVNGEKVAEGMADRDWSKDQDPGKFNVKAGEWNAILVEVGENGGEWGFSMRVEPPPDDHTLDTQILMAVNNNDKLTTTWANIKR